MKEYTIQPIRVGLTTRDKSATAYMTSPGTPYDTPLLCFYLTDGERKILVDTGGDPADGVRHMPYVQTREELLENALPRMGVRCEDIDTVILTHLHWDHCSNNRLFPNAVFYVQREELRYAAAPLAIHRRLYDPALIFQTEYRVLDGDGPLFDGISVLLTPGHSPGSQTVLVNTSAGICALTGDLVTIYECWEAEPKIINGLHNDIGVYYESLAKVEKACDFILPGHDLKVLERRCYP